MNSKNIESIINDCLYRISLKCLITNNHGQVLVVKETGRKSWDLPGGGIDHHEDIKSAIARELREEINLQGDFTYQIIGLDEPSKLSTRDIWQVRLILRLTPQNLDFSAGEHGDEVRFINPGLLKESDHESERKIYGYANIT